MSTLTKKRINTTLLELQDLQNLLETYNVGRNDESKLLPSAITVSPEQLRALGKLIAIAIEASTFLQGGHTGNKTTVKIPEDIRRDGRSVNNNFPSGRIAPARKIASAMDYLSLESASFYFANDDMSDAIKAHIQNWLSSWVIPPLTEAYRKLTKTQD